MCTSAGTRATTNTELYVTYLDVPAGALPRIDVPDPGNCDF